LILSPTRFLVKAEKLMQLAPHLASRGSSGAGVLNPLTRRHGSQEGRYGVKPFPLVQ
jgi:hypothetical protein